MFSRQRSIGLDGLATLLLSNMVIVLTAGTSLLWQFGAVHRVAKTAPFRVRSGRLVLVLGARLNKDRPSRDFRLRLLRARTLATENSARHVWVLGGKTNGNLRTEADVGVEFLATHGIPRVRLFTENSSRHTLENLHRARARLPASVLQDCILVSNRYHLARAAALATGLGLEPRLCAAEEWLTMNARSITLLLRESYYLHWYHVGRRWSQWTGNRRSLARIS